MWVYYCFMLLGIWKLGGEESVRKQLALCTAVLG